MSSFAKARDMNAAMIQGESENPGTVSDCLAKVGEGPFMNLFCIEGWFTYSSVAERRLYEDVMMKVGRWEENLGSDKYRC